MKPVYASRGKLNSPPLLACVGIGSVLQSGRNYEKARQPTEPVFLAVARGGISIIGDTSHVTAFTGSSTTPTKVTPGASGGRL
jgi:hypothetical protein